MAARLRLANLLGGLSIVADLGFGLPPETAMRSCLIGTALARELDVAEKDVADTFYTSLMLHVGCPAFAHEAAAAMGDELTVNSAVAKTNFADPRDVLKTFIPEATRGMSPRSQVRATTFIVTRGKSFGKRYETASCEVARETARRLGLSGSLQRALYEVHEWWKGGGAPRGLKGEEIALPARIARVASDAALFDDIGGPRPGCRRAPAPCRRDARSVDRAGVHRECPGASGGGERGGPPGADPRGGARAGRR